MFIVLGRAYLGGMCSSTSSMASSNAYGLSAGLAVAHETGHKYVTHRKLIQK